MSDPLTNIAAGVTPHGLPDGATPVHGCTQAAIDTTTAVPVLAAPGAGLSYYITEILATNSTPGEPTSTLIRDTAGSPAVHAAVDAGQGGAPAEPMRFHPPLKIPANLGVSAIASKATTGDTYVTINGYVGAA